MCDNKYKINLFKHQLVVECLSCTVYKMFSSNWVHELPYQLHRYTFHLFGKKNIAMNKTWFNKSFWKLNRSTAYLIFFKLISIKINKNNQKCYNSKSNNCMHNTIRFITSRLCWIALLVICIVIVCNVVLKLSKKKQIYYIICILPKHFLGKNLLNAVLKS